MPNTTSKRTSKSKTSAQSPLQDNFGHLQPQDIKLEEAVLGALMIDKEAIDRVLEILEPESFYEKKHQLIFTAIRQLNIDECPIDLLTVVDELGREGTLDEVGGAYYVTQLTEKVVSSAHIEYHALLIAQKATARALISYTSDIQTKAFDPTIDVDELMQEAEGNLFKLSQKHLKQDYTHIAPVLKDAYHLINLAAAQKEGLSGVPSGFYELDKLTAGWQKSDLIIMAARPGVGKTAFALSMAKNIAIDQKTPMAFFSLEMSSVQLVNRLISNVCEISGEKIRSGQLLRHEWGQLDYKIKEMSDAPLYLDETPNLSVFELRTKARRLYKEHGIKLIMIDYLQLMNASGMHFSSRQEEVSMISRSLKGLAKELNIPIIALSQLNRNLTARDPKEGDGKGQRPQLSDLRESGAIEQDADIVLFIHRPEAFGLKKDAHGNDVTGLAEIILAKHRSGGMGEFEVEFKKDFTRFQNKDAGTSYIPLPGENVAASTMAPPPPAPQTEGIAPAPDYPF
ncbi:MAG: replicative DNA helicase [Alloprevotella sp.]|nr:replicative DNA helicase [Alloprevotella sp.]